MRIKVNKEKNRVYINGNEFAIVTEYEDDEFGHVLKCCTLSYQDYAKFFLVEREKKYLPITDETSFQKLVKKYDKPASSIIIN